MKVPCKDIPTYDYSTKKWSTTSFEDQTAFGLFLKEHCFREPGQYKFDERVFKWNEQSRRFDEKGSYTDYAPGTPEYDEYWDTEELKSRLGVIWKDKDITWYTTRDYYFLLNFCPIVNKEKGYIDSFPDIRDVQYHMMLYEKLAEIFNKHSAILKRRQMLFEQPHSSLILAKDGWTTMGEVEIGDEIRNPEGHTCKVIDKSNNGIKPIYRVTLDDGTEIRCGEHHLWEVIKDGEEEPIVTTTKKLLEAGLYENKLPKYRIENISPIEYKNKKQRVPAYLVGVLLGRGDVNEGITTFTVEEEDIISFLTSYTNIVSDKITSKDEGISLTCTIDSKYFYQYSFDPRGILKKGKENLFIPERYKYSTVQDRIDLLQGLMDSNGFISHNGDEIYYETLSKQLANDIWLIAKELGITAKIVAKENIYRILFLGKIPITLFKTFGKKLRFVFRSPKGKSGRYILEIVNTGVKEECSCIMVDDLNHLYITDNYTITHNSFCHVAKTVNYLYFENKKKLKWFASDASFIDDVNGSWVILDQYKAHLNKHTGWFRSFSPDKGGEIQQRQAIKKFGKWDWDGNMSSVVGKTLNKDPKLGVGGPTYWAWYEEGGIAPTADITLQYMEPAMTSGLTRVGSFCIGGSVGDLSECKPLENFMKDPSTYGFYGVPTTLFDESGAENTCGLFIPAQYGMPEATDEYGNSQVEKAIQLLDKAEFEGFQPGEHGRIEYEPPWKALPTEQYILKKSQNPRTIKDAFAWRKSSFFDLQILKNSMDRLELSKPHIINCELYEDNNGAIKWKNVQNRAAITVFPFKDVESSDKRGCVQIYELPCVEKGQTEPTPRTYFAGIDPIQTDVTTTSNSLFCIYIFKNITRIKYIDEETGEVKIRTEGYKPVAWYLGRYEDRKKTNTQAEYLLRLYNAFALCESNVTSFIDHMRAKNLENKYLMTKREASRIYGEDVVTETVESGVGYGIAMTMTGKLKNHILNKEKEYTEEILDTIIDKDGKVIKTVYGAERIPDIGLLRELSGYRKGINTDRIVAFGLALSACEMYAHSGIISDYDSTEMEPDVIPIVKPKAQFFSSQKQTISNKKTFFSQRMGVNRKN